MMQTQQNASMRTITQEIVHRTQKHALGFDVGPSGTIHASTAIVAEAPGERECSMKMPLVGGAGLMLWNTLRPTGINRHELYVTNVCKRQISLSTQQANLKRPLTRRDEALWRDILLWELSQLPNLKNVVVLGSIALKTLLGLEGINKWRGSIIQRRLFDKDLTFIIINNPAAALHSPSEEVIFKFHCSKITRVLQNKYTPYVIDTYINPTYKDACDYLLELISIVKRKSIRLAFDIETPGNETACIGIAASGHAGMCVPFYKTDWSQPQEVRLRTLFNTLFNNKNIQLIAQNGVFDCTYLWYKDRMRVKPLWFDTLLAHHTLYPKLPHNLGFLTTQYTDHPYYKDEKDDWRETGDLDTFWQYNVKDCAITFEIHKQLLNELNEQKLQDFFFNHVMRAQAHIALMSVGGILIDETYKARVTEELNKDLIDLRLAFDTQVAICTGKDVKYNPQSPKQMKELYFKELKLTGRGVSTDKTSRDIMVDSPRTPDECKTLIHTHNKYVKEAKFLSTYAEARIDPDGRMRTEYKQFGTQSAPGRLSSSSNGWGTGSNLQNQPQRAYPMFIADKGYSFVYFDCAQAEARIVAWRAGIRSWMDQFERARVDGVFDCHKALAADMFGVAYDQVPSEDRDADGNPTIRFIAKRCRHGLNYRMHIEKLAETTGLSISKAREAYIRYHKITPEIKIWWDLQVDQYLKTKTIHNAYGRRMLLMEKPTDDALDSLIAFYPQSTLGDKVVRIIYLCHDDLDWPADARICLNIHDALVAVCRHVDVPRVARIMKEYAEEPIDIRSIIDGSVRSLIIPADFKISQPDEHGIHRWSTLVKYKPE